MSRSRAKHEFVRIWSGTIYSEGSSQNMSWLAERFVPELFERFDQSTFERVDLVGSPPDPSE